MSSNKALKHVQRVALNWTPSTGAASHYRAGFSRRLALRYVSHPISDFRIVAVTSLRQSCSRAGSVKFFSWFQ